MGDHNDRFRLIEDWFGEPEKRRARRENWLASILFVLIVFYVVAFTQGWTVCP
jgi:hypothetical protein